MSGMFLYVFLVDGQEVMCELEEATSQLNLVQLNQVINTYLAERVEGEVASWELLTSVEGRLRELQMMMRSWVPIDVAWQYRMVPFPKFSDN